MFKKTKARLRGWALRLLAKFSRFTWAKEMYGRLAPTVSPRYIVRPRGWQPVVVGRPLSDEEKKRLLPDGRLVEDLLQQILYDARDAAQKGGDVKAVLAKASVEVAKAAEHLSPPEPAEHKDSQALKDLAAQMSALDAKAAKEEVDSQAAADAKIIRELAKAMTT
jgi:hypothetical protein